MHIPPGYAMFIPSAIREAVDLPVIGVGRFKDPLQAERALQEGQCDLVGVVRAQIADPDFVRKARGGYTDDTRLCLSCNQECVGRMGLNRWLGCIENPRTGRESQGVGLSTPVAIGRRVLVIGAGPAGMQAAIAAARNGHHVTIAERSEAAGGMVRLAASVPNRAEFGDLVRNQIHECERLDVHFEYGVDVTVDEVRRRNPDVVVVATGSQLAMPYWAPAERGPDDAWIVDVTEVLGGFAHPSGDVLVVDELGFHQATSVAELLADRGCKVEIVTPGMVVGQDLGITLDMENWWIRAESKGITQTTDCGVMSLDGRTVNLQHHPTGAQLTRQPDYLVMALPGAPADALYHDLRGAGLEVYRVGDAVAPRRAHAAVIDGERIGSAITSGTPTPVSIEVGG